MSNPKIFLQPELIEGDNIDIAQDGKTISSNTPLENITNTDITEVEDGQALIYDETSGKWVNGEGGTPIEPNPAAAATDTLSTIKIDNTVFTIGGGGTGDAVLYPLTTAEYNALTPEQKMDENVLYLLTDGGSGGGGGGTGGGFYAPDYENPETITLTPLTWVTYNVTQNGYVMVDLTAFTETGGTSVKVNGTTLNFDKVDGTNYILNSTYMFPVMANDVVEIRLNYNGSGYGSNTALFFPAKGGGSGGSNVIPNPEDTATDTLSTVEIDGTIYKLSGEEYEAGENINITNNVISAIDTIYTAGTNIQINAQNEISAHENMAGETIPTSNEGNNNAIYMQYSTTGGETDYETIWTGSVSTSAWASPVQIGTINPSEYYRIKITGTGNGERLVSEIPVVRSGDLWHLGHEMYIFTANDCTELWLYSSTGYANTVTKVEATTYDEKMVDSIEKVYGKIKDNWYEIATGGDTNIVPNPQGTATDTLNTVGIDGTIFNLPSSSSGGSGYSETTLWENTSGLSFNANSQQTITLSDNLNNYKMICLLYSDSASPAQRSLSIYLVSHIDTSGTIGFWLTPLMPDNSIGSPCSFYVSNNQIRLNGITTRTTMVAYKIIGIKFGGGRTTFEGLDYSNATDLTLPDNTGYTYTPSKDGVIMVTAYGNVGALAVQQDNFEAIHLAHGSDRWTTSWCFVEKGVNYTLSSTSRSNSWPSGSWVKFIPLKQSSSGGGGSPEVNYSTDEQKIGTWIDGKPLYQITLELNVSLNTTSWISVNIDSFVKQIKNIIHFDAMTDDDVNTYNITGTIYELQPYQNNGVQMIDIHCTTTGRVLKYLTIQYTKTTD